MKPNWRQCELYDHCWIDPNGKHIPHYKRDIISEHVPVKSVDRMDDYVTGLCYRALVEMKSDDLDDS